VLIGAMSHLLGVKNIKPPHCEVNAIYWQIVLYIDDQKSSKVGIKLLNLLNVIIFA